MVQKLAHCERHGRAVCHGNGLAHNAALARRGGAHQAALFKNADAVGQKLGARGGVGIHQHHNGQLYLLVVRGVQHGHLAALFLAGNGAHRAQHVNDVHGLGQAAAVVVAHVQHQAVNGRLAARHGLQRCLQLFFRVAVEGVNAHIAARLPLGHRIFKAGHIVLTALQLGCLRLARKVGGRDGDSGARLAAQKAVHLRQGKVAHIGFANSGNHPVLFKPGLLGGAVGINAHHTRVPRGGVFHHIHAHAHHLAGMNALVLGVLCGRVVHGVASPMPAIYPAPIMSYRVVSLISP